MIAFEGWQSFVLFCITLFILIATPGPATLCIIARSLADGPVGGLLCTIGLVLGSLLIGILCLWLSLAMLDWWPTLQGMACYCGAVYFLYLAVRLSTSRYVAWADDPIPVPAVAPKDRAPAILSSGLLVNLSNPGLIFVYGVAIPAFAKQCRYGEASGYIMLGVIYICFNLYITVFWRCCLAV